MGDLNDEVRLSVLCQLGDIIVNLDNGNDKNDLIISFIKIPQTHFAFEDNGEILVRNYAKRFADILAQMGAWDDYRKCFMTLCYSEYASVRLIACKSLCKIAKIIGKDNTAQDLCPLLEKFLSDDKKIKKACFKLIGDFYTAIPEKYQLQLLNFLKNYKVKD